MMYSIRGRFGGLLIAATFALFPFASVHASFSNTPNADSLGLSNSGNVDSIALDTTTGIEYIAGSFTYVGPSTGNTAVLDTATHAARTGGQKLINGTVDKIISDGAGGYYAGGRFFLNTNTSTTGTCLAHILADGSLDTTVSATLVSCATVGHVYALQLVGTTLYVGGNFSSVDGQTRNYIASIDTTTGHATSWSPAVNGIVQSLLVNGGVVYVGTNNHDDDLNAFDATTGVQTSFAPAISGIGSSDTVNTLAISGDGTTLYAGGRFDTVHAVSRNNLVAIDTSTGVPTSWNPAPNSYVYALALDGTNLYVGGSFSSIGGATRNSLAVVDTGTGTAGSWDPEPDGEVHGIAIDGSTIYAAGFFANVGSTGRLGLAAIDKTTGNLTSWDTETDLESFSVAVDGTNLFVSGDFSSAGGAQRSNLAAIDTTTNTVTSWNPGADREVTDLVLSGGKLYAGGSFFTVDGQSRQHLVAFDTATGNVTSWDPGADLDGSVYSLAASGQNVYVGGTFSTIGGATRHYLAAIDATTGLATSWDPEPDSSISTLAVNGNTVYASGYFSNIGTTPRAYLAAIDATTGLATNWDPNPDDAEYIIIPSGSLVYVGGDFTTLGSSTLSTLVTRHRIAAIDATTGLATSWDPNAGSSVFSLALKDTSAYVGGFFTTIGGQTRNKLAEIDLTTGLATSWNPNPDSYPVSMVTDGSALYAGGSFYSFNDVYQPYLTQFGTAATPTGPVDTTPPTAGSSGTLAAASVTSSALTLNWTKATDDTDAQSLLQYRVYQSSSNNIGSVANAESNGTPLNSYTTDINTYGVAGLSASTQYYFTVIVKDSAGNKTAYNVLAQMTSAATSGTTGGTSSHKSGSGTSIQVQVQNLLKAGKTADAQALMAQWPNLFPAQSVPATPVSPATGSNGASAGISASTFTRNLTVGVSGADVTALQTWLMAKGFSIPAGATGYFGAQTKAALAAFQAANAITPAAGYFGPITRGYITTH